jgi:hypothetical protein
LPKDPEAGAEVHLRNAKTCCDFTATSTAHGGQESTLHTVHHFGGGRPHTGTRVLLLIHDLHVRVINATTGELLRELTLGPGRDYQPTGRPSHTRPASKSPEP